MATADIISSMATHLKAAYDMLESKGAIIPENKNVANLATAILSIPTTPPITPPDLSKVLDKEALDNLQNIVAQGEAEKYLSLGDELLVSYGDYTMPFEIVGFEDVEVEGGEMKPAINLLAKYVSTEYSTWGTFKAPYSSSSIRTALTNTYQNKLDQNFVECLANTKIQRYNFDGSTSTVYDKLFVPSMAQLGITDTKYNTASQASIEGPAFAAYQNATDQARIRTPIVSPALAVVYWTSTVYNPNGYGYGVILSSGEPSWGNYSASWGIVAACNFTAS